MNYEQMHFSKPVNQQRRKLLQGVAGVTTAAIAPAVFGKALSSSSESALSGKLVCNISDPVKTLVLRNHSDQAIVLDQLSQGALMFDGTVVDCNAACMTKSVTIPANQEVQVQFDKRQQFASNHKVDDFRRMQSRVTRLSDGTRVIPFTATVRGGVATLI